MQLTKRQLEDLIEVLDTAQPSEKRDAFLKLARNTRWAMSTLSREELEARDAALAAGKAKKIAAGVSAVQDVVAAAKAKGGEGLLASLGITFE